MTIFVTWQLIVTLDSSRNSCDVFIKSTKIGVFYQYGYIDITKNRDPCSYGLIMDMEGSIMNQFHLLDKNCQNMQFFASKMNPFLIVLTIMILKESSERHNRKWNCHLATSAYLLSLRIFSFVWIFLRKILSADPLYILFWFHPRNHTLHFFWESLL